MSLSPEAHASCEGTDSARWGTATYLKLPMREGTTNQITVFCNDR